MMQWTLVCGLATLFATETVKAVPIVLDETERTETVTYLDANFPGFGARIEGVATTTDTTGVYNPGVARPAAPERRLEGTKTTDMEKLETFFQMELEIDITKLPTKCQQDPIPWPGSYWPTYADSCNYQWRNGSLSPTEKYAKAFGYDVIELLDKISAKRGVDSQSKRRPCKKDAECKSLKDDSVCAKRRGKSSGYCIPKWFGICHAWAPAAILEAEPSCPVTRNGVTFEPYDIKALITLAYDGSKIPTLFMGTRFNNDAKAINGTDEYGRFLDTRRRDISPGFFHIAITNIMGRFNSSFVVDITAGNEVWNQPVRGYEIIRMSWMSPAAAAKKYFKVDKYPFNDAATKIAAVTTRFSWVVESGLNGPLVSTGLADKSTKSADYEYLLETDSTYKILGGEWCKASLVNHPDFIWLPTAKPDNDTITSVGLKYGEIESLVYDSVHNCKAASKTPDMPGSIRPPPPTESPDANYGSADGSSSGAEPAASSPPAAYLAAASGSNAVDTLDAVATDESGSEEGLGEDDKVENGSPAAANPAAPGNVHAAPGAAPAAPGAAPAASDPLSEAAAAIAAAQGGAPAAPGVAPTAPGVAPTAPGAAPAAPGDAPAVPGDAPAAPSDAPAAPGDAPAAPGAAPTAPGAAPAARRLEQRAPGDAPVASDPLSEAAAAIAAAQGGTPAVPGPISEAAA